MKKKLLHISTTCLLLLLLTSIGHGGEVQKVAIFPFEAHSKEDIAYIQRGIVSLLPPRISVHNRISVLDRNLVAGEFLKSGEGKTVQEKLPVAEKLGADFLLSGSITKIGAGVSVDTVLVDVKAPENRFQLFIQSDDFDSIIPELNKMAQRIKDIIIDDPGFVEAEPGRRYDDPRDRPEVAMDYRDAYRPEPLKPVAPMVAPSFDSVPMIRFTTTGIPAAVMASGDVNGNGSRDILIASRRQISVYETSADGFIQTATIKFPVGVHIVALDCGDFNQNGIDEIYVSSFHGRFPNSQVVEYEDGQFKTLLSDQRFFFRVVDGHGEEPTLLAQSAVGSNPFTGDIWRLEWEEDELIQKQKVSIPRDMGIYSFTRADIDGDRTPDYMGFHRTLFGGEKLSLFSYTGRVKWVDPQDLGGSTNTFTVSYLGDDVEREEAVPVRIICHDFNRDGKMNVVIAKNAKARKGAIGFLYSYTEGEVLSLYWDGIDFLTNWSSGQLGGYIADYIAEDIDGDGKKELIILSVTQPDFFRRSENTVTVFKQK